jgi:hypothetical protein
MASFDYRSWEQIRLAGFGKSPPITPSFEWMRRAIAEVYGLLLSPCLIRGQRVLQALGGASGGSRDDGRAGFRSILAADVLMRVIRSPSI